MSDLLQRAQARFLKELFHTSRGGFVLKGGMAMSVLFGSSRLTRDVDLDFPPPGARTADSLHNQVLRALKQALRGTGLSDVRISEPGKAELSPKWKVSGRDPAGAPFNMRIEVSRRPPPPGVVRQVAVAGGSTYGLGTYYVDLYDERALAAMKLAALLGRTAVRDVCDLDLLLPANVPGAELVDWATRHAGLSPQVASEAIAAKLGLMDFALFQTQMLGDPALTTRVDEAQWQQMRDRVGATLTTVLAGHAPNREAP